MTSAVLEERKLPGHVTTVANVDLVDPACTTSRSCRNSSTALIERVLHNRGPATVTSRSFTSVAGARRPRRYRDCALDDTPGGGLTVTISLPVDAQGAG